MALHTSVLFGGNREPDQVEGAFQVKRVSEASKLFPPASDFAWEFFSIFTRCGFTA